jgi:hypothetical protein
MMNSMIEAFPLCWPIGYPRTKYATGSRFRGSTFDQARKGVINEIKRLGGTSVIVSTNLPLRNDGNPYASAPQPEDRGVAVYFTYKNNQVVFACDKWNQIGDNMKAIEKAISAIRGLERWGVSDMLNRAFSGFKALPENANASSNKDCYAVLGIPKTATADQIRAAYREKVKTAHPDNGGSNELFIETQTAYEQAMRAL